MSKSSVAGAVAELGKQLDERWRCVGYRAAAFPELAVAALAQCIATGDLRGNELARWAIATDELPRQANVPISFGQPPITLYRTDRFYVEALYWLDGTTAIHDHAFAGAFAVLEGSSLHTTFEFVEHEYIDDRIRAGQLTRHESELLSAGSVRPIVAGRSFVHSVFHLDRPSVSLTVRTYADAQAYPQLEYRAPGLAMDSSFMPEGPTRRLAVLDMLANIESAEFAPALTALLLRSDLLHCFRALEQTALHVFASQYLAQGFAVVDERYPNQSKTLRAAIAETKRQRNLIGRRELIRHPDHRFLLALLLNITKRSELLTMVSARTGATDAIAQVMTWLRELAGAADATLGIALDAIGLATLEGLLRGLSESEICANCGGPPMQVAKWSLTLPRTHLLRGLLS